MVVLWCGCVVVVLWYGCVCREGKGGWLCGKLVVLELVVLELVVWEGAGSFVFLGVARQCVHVSGFYHDAIQSTVISIVLRSFYLFLFYL